MFTLAILLIAGVATSTVFAGDVKGTTPMSGKTCTINKTQHTSEGSAQGAAGEKESIKATAAQGSCCASGKAACGSEKGDKAGSGEREGDKVKSSPKTAKASHEKLDAREKSIEEIHFNYY